MLRKPSKLLGVGFKGYHGTSIGNALFHNLTREVELVRDRKLVEVFVKQPSNDQGPPKYCVVPPEKAAEFERAAALGADGRKHPQPHAARHARVPGAGSLGSDL